MNDVEVMLENACRLTRIPVGGLRSEREARDVVAWADASLQVFYAAGDHELSCDVTDGKRTALEVRYIGNQYLSVARCTLRHEKYSDIVGLSNSLAGQLGVMCEALCPELSIYLQSRIRLGTY
jgi:hypothetical protein